MSSGALRGAMTFTRYFVIGKLENDSVEALAKRVRAYAFKPLDAEEDTHERCGWSDMADPHQLDVEAWSIYSRGLMTLSLRIDRWVIPGPLLKSSLREAETNLKERKGLERLGKRAKAELKALVVKKLRSQLVPEMKVVNVVWDRAADEVLFFSHSKRHRTLVEELFERTFKLQLLIESPGTLADAIERELPEDLESTSLEGAVAA